MVQNTQRRRTQETTVTVVGAGLAGSEAAWQLAEAGFAVHLLEMRPHVQTPAHKTEYFGELVCSNSFKSTALHTSSGLLKAELDILGSFILQQALAHRLPAGSALAVDRLEMARTVTQQLSTHPRIEITRTEAAVLPDPPAIIASGPLTADSLAAELARVAGTPLYFYDAIAPIVETATLDRAHCFTASRWQRSNTSPDKDGKSSSADYINCPLSEAQYIRFIEALLAADKVKPHPFEKPRYFEACLPVEVMAARGFDALRHGPMRPVGLRDPHTGARPYAVVQLRAENRHLTAHNMVGFQTRLTYPAQKQVFRLIPALQNVRFLRLGSIHRNTYLRAPDCLNAQLQLKNHTGVAVAGLLSGVEGYVESVAMGWLAAFLTVAALKDRKVAPPPQTTAVGGLYRYLLRPHERDQPFVPTNMNFSLLPPLEATLRKNPKKKRRLLIAERALADLRDWRQRHLGD
jgi:methylenetetrahydrofolate--tRNA-(uracil-5-)-methyltransferase